MDIRNVGRNTNPKIERSNADRASRPDAKRDDLGSVAANRDDARISETGRETAAAIEGLAKRAQQDGGDREELVAAALKKLQSGELDSQATLADTARRLADRGFLSA